MLVRIRIVEIILQKLLTICIVFDLYEIMNLTFSGRDVPIAFAISFGLMNTAPSVMVLSCASISFFVMPTPSAPIAGARLCDFVAD